MDRPVSPESSTCEELDMDAANEKFIYDMLGAVALSRTEILKVIKKRMKHNTGELHSKMDIRAAIESCGSQFIETLCRAPSRCGSRVGSVVSFMPRSNSGLIRSNDGCQPSSRQFPTRPPHFASAGDGDPRVMDWARTHQTHFGAHSGTNNSNADGTMENSAVCLETHFLAEGDISATSLVDGQRKESTKSVKEEKEKTVNGESTVKVGDGIEQAEENSVPLVLSDVEDKPADNCDGVLDGSVDAVHMEDAAAKPPQGGFQSEDEEKGEAEQRKASEGSEDSDSDHLQGVVESEKEEAGQLEHKECAPSSDWDDGGEMGQPGPERSQPEPDDLEDEPTQRVSFPSSENEDEVFAKPEPSEVEACDVQMDHNESGTNGEETGCQEEKGIRFHVLSEQSETVRDEKDREADTVRTVEEKPALVQQKPDWDAGLSPPAETECVYKAFNYTRSDIKPAKIPDPEKECIVTSFSNPNDFFFIQKEDEKSLLQIRNRCSKWVQSLESRVEFEFSSAVELFEDLAVLYKDGTGRYCRAVIDTVYPHEMEVSLTLIDDGMCVSRASTRNLLRMPQDILKWRTRAYRGSLCVLPRGADEWSADVCSKMREMIQAKWTPFIVSFEGACPLTGYHLVGMARVNDVHSKKGWFNYALYRHSLAQRYDELDESSSSNGSTSASEDDRSNWSEADSTGKQTVMEKDGSHEKGEPARVHCGTPVPKGGLSVSCLNQAEEEGGLEGKTTPTPLVHVGAPSYPTLQIHSREKTDVTPEQSEKCTTAVGEEKSVAPSKPVVKSQFGSGNSTTCTTAVGEENSIAPSKSAVRSQFGSGNSTTCTLAVGDDTSIAPSKPAVRSQFGSGNNTTSAFRPVPPVIVPAASSRGQGSIPRSFGFASGPKKTGNPPVVTQPGTVFRPPPPIGITTPSVGQRTTPAVPSQFGRPPVVIPPKPIRRDIPRN